MTAQCKKPKQRRPGVPPGHDHPESSVTISGIRSVPKQTVANTLRHAAEAGIMDVSNVDKSVQAFVEFAAEYKFNNKILGALSSAKDFVSKARIPTEDRVVFEKVIREEATGNLWERAKTAGVSDVGIKKLQVQGKLAYLTFNNVELADYLADLVTSDAMSLIELGFYDEAKWKGALRTLAGADNAKLGALIPPAFSGKNLDERLIDYSAELARRVRQMDPHAVTVDRVATGKIGGVAEQDGVRKFLEKAVPLGFRLGKVPLGAFVAKNESALWSGITVEKREDVLTSVRTLSSLYATSPTDEALNALLLAGFTSATAIVKYDYFVFAELINKHLPTGHKGGDQKVSEKIFWKAQQQSATVFNVFDGLKRLNSVGPVMGSTPQNAIDRDDQIVKTRAKLAGMFPTLEALFGSVDYCQCDQCQSVLSPAAYLVDLLHFIDPKEEAWVMVKASYQARTGLPYGKLKPFDALNNRRPDVKNIALTCENTHTALPYIDIVNEVLEQLMMTDATPPAINAYDVGDMSSQDLLAEPQNILWSAYIGADGKPGLRDLIYPVTLPFDLPLEMGRSFLKQLGLPLWRLREYLTKPSTLGPSANGRTDGWTDVWLERLGLGSSDVSALTRTDEWHELFGYFGYAAESDALKMETVDGRIRPVEASLGNAKTLARRLDVSYEELVELIRTRFINPEIENLIVLKGLGVDPSTIDRYFGESPALSSTERTEFEVRLLVQGVTAAELKALRAPPIRKATLELRSPSIGCDFSKTTLAFDLAPAAPQQAMAFVLRKMNAFVRLQKKLGWEIHELDRALMALMPGIATVSMATWADAMKTALIYLAHVEELRERFEDRLSREEIITLWGDIPTVGSSCLYERLFTSPGASGRNDVFKKKLGKVLQNTGALIDHADAVRQAFALAHEDIEPILVAANPANRVLSIENLSILMRYAVLAKGLGLSIPELLTLMKLSERKPLSSLDATPLADLTKDVPWSETLAFIREVDLLRDAGVDVAFLDRLCRYQGVGEQPAADKDPVLIALAALPPADPTPTEKQQTLVVQTLAAQLSVPEAIINKQLGSVLKDAANKPLKETGFSDPGKSVATLQKLRMALDLVQSLGITEGELQYIIGVPGALNPNSLPVAVVTDDAIARSLRKGLTGWLELAAARKQFGQSERMLAVLAAAKQPIDATNTSAVREQQLHQAMVALTGLRLPGLALSLEAIGAKSAGGASFEVSALSDPAKLRKTIEALKCFARLGLNPNEVVQFASIAMDKTAAQKLRSSVKAKYAVSTWRGVAKPIFDGLRKKQRDALVAHLTHVMDGPSAKYGETAEKLFEYLLLDPGMEPVVDASRIQLAIASVQLFVQRCLMNLELHVGPQIIDNKRWEWMRRYRVWEVNRKMYIWPENWLDPEFRDDKTHLFRDLEGKLLQGDVNDDLVRTSLQSYLKGLEEIACIEMLTMYFEPSASADGSMIHVIGRTPNAPHKYLYRKVSHGMWTPWEPIDVGIEGEHLVLTAWRGRMYLFWVSFLEQAKENPGIPITFSAATGSVAKADLLSISQVKLQLHWVEQVQGKWVGRNSTLNFVDTDFERFKATDDEQKREFFVRAVVVEHGAGVEDDDLEIHITRGGKAHKFVFFSKLAPPRSHRTGSLPVSPPFDDLRPGATKWRGGVSGLWATFVSAVTQSSKTGKLASGEGTHMVIRETDPFALLFPSNSVLSVPARTPPAGVGRPTGYVFRQQNAQHVAYRSGDGGIHDVFWTKNGWFYQSPSTDAMSSGAANDAEPASSDPHGYAVDEQGTICIAYSGDTKLHELVWSQLDSSLDDPTHRGTGWRFETLYEGATVKEEPIGRPFGGIFLPRRGVAFRTKDGQLRAAVKSADSAWQIQELNARLPKAKSDPTGLLMTKKHLGVTSVVSRHLFYLGDDGHVHELQSDVTGQQWTHTNITERMLEIIKPAPGSTLASYAFLERDTLHVVYRGEDDRIHELQRKAAGLWKYTPIGAEFTEAKGDPAGYVTEWISMQHVVYRGTEDEVVELWWSNGQWRENVLTQSASGAPKSNSDVAGYSFESINTQHAVYFSKDGSPRELWWAKGGWHSGAYELANPFPDDVGPLASPFFYESSGKDHTFFVEPYVIEKAVHEWTEWIVTSEAYVEPQLVDKKLPVKLIPHVVELEPSTVSLIKSKPDRYSKTVYGEGVVVRTPRGVIEPQIRLNADSDMAGVVLAGKTLKMVDVTKGPQAAIDPRTPNIRLGGLR